MEICLVIWGTAVSAESEWFNRGMDITCYSNRHLNICIPGQSLVPALALLLIYLPANVYPGKSVDGGARAWISDTSVGSPNGVAASSFQSNAVWTVVGTWEVDQHMEDICLLYSLNSFQGKLKRKPSMAMCRGWEPHKEETLIISERSVLGGMHLSNRVGVELICERGERRIGLNEGHKE